METCLHNNAHPNVASLNESIHYNPSLLPPNTHTHTHTQFHRECIDEWLRSGHSTCPVDGQSLYNPAKKRQRRLLLSRRNSPQGDEAMTAGRRMVGSLAKAMRQNSCGFSNEEFTISGQSIGMGSPQER